jgi:hypothetical protein
MGYKNKAVIILFILLACSCKNKDTHNVKNDVSNESVFSESIIGKWYRNSLYFESELTINNEMIFTIEAQSSANSGRVTGQLTKIKDRYYFSYINDQYDSGASCVIIITEDIGKIELIVYGDQINAGNGVYYDGIYEKNQWTKDERIGIALDRIIGNHFDKNTVKQLLKDDLEYFTECFAGGVLNNDNNKIIIEGWLKGVAPWQNGIIKIENNNIYILITDCRGDDLLFRYYSTDKIQKDIPKEFITWYYYKENIEIIYENNR